KLSYFWKHCYGKSRSGRYLGSLTNPDTGCPVETDGVRLSALDFEKKRLHQIVEDSKAGRTKYSALWQADCSKIARMAPAEYMGRFMPEWWDYAIADEIHQLAGDTAQGNALAVLNRTARQFLGLTGTLLSGYADDLFNTLFRTDAKRMIEDGYQWGCAGRERFTRDFGVIETIERITSRRQCLLQKNQEDGHDQTQARCLTAVVRQISDGPLRVHRPGGHLGRAPKLPRGSRAGDDGRAAEDGFRGARRGDHCLPEGASWKQQRSEHHAECTARMTGPSLWFRHSVRF